MNKVRREKIAKVINVIGSARDSLEDILNEEQEYYDNIPENLLGGERAETSEEAIEIMESMFESLNEVIDELEEIA